MKMMILIAGIFTASSEAALMDDYEFHGNSCHSTTPGLTARISQYGVYNASSTQAMTVACPVVLPELVYTSGFLAFWGYNRNDNDDLSCTINFSSTEGSGLQSRNAVIANSGTPLQSGKSGRLVPTADNINFWMYCRIPPTQNGAASHVTRVILSMEYASQ
jgi:hypothetical protein